LPLNKASVFNVESVGYPGSGSFHQEKHMAAVPTKATMPAAMGRLR
jgi:hypothetical protein